MALRKPFTSELIRQTWTPPPSLQGRALAARLKGGFFDLFVCCMYLPPRPQTASKRGGYQRTVERLLEWLDGCLSDQRHRTLESVLSSFLADIVLSTVSALRLQVHVVNTWRASFYERLWRNTTCGLPRLSWGCATWFGDAGSSLIDYVWAPAALPLRCSGPSEDWQRNCS